LYESTAVRHTPRLIGLVRWVLQPIDLVDVLWVERIEDGMDFFIRLVYREYVLIPFRLKYAYCIKFHLQMCLSACYF
jgi:hypothetical protein